MKMKQFIAAGTAALLAAGIFAGCGSTPSEKPSDSVMTSDAEIAAETEEEAVGEEAAGEEAPEAAADAEAGKVSIVCTTFPQYDWTMQLVKGMEEQFDVTYLMESGVDLHSYQASAEDIAEIGESDLFIYVGGESDGWVEDTLANAVNPELRSINMLEALGDAVKEEELVEGMEAEEEEEEEAGEEEEGPEYDEHVWTSLKNAQELTKSIAAELEAIAPEQADAVQSNCEAYVAELAELDAKYADVVGSAKLDTVLFGDRFPFRYLVDDYGLNYYAAFVGCSAETEASFETITFLAGKTDELKLPAILVIENSDQKIAETIRDNTESKDQKILIMDSLQSVSAEDIATGRSFLGAMESNLGTLTAALGAEQ
ncbi:metal ABC transporter substrate-binding protein [Lachnoclostridium sp. Marseille-P6806]|uniref:metal ABC transporter substrate-binding protein n=1 Tax=Lachnoclostridium sp. Marseille-P6806 TaxID=2364793 RepID=UPI00103233FE|nr:metal ABC transporter substrate-binding protein [Lachnoclostridium sp. Marseille-P6806]